MTLTLRLSDFTWGQRVPLTDETGRTRFHLLGDAYAPGKRLHLYDLASRETFCVRQKFPSLLPRFEITLYGRPVGELFRSPDASAPILSAEGWECSETAERVILLRDGAETGRCTLDGGLLTVTVEDRAHVPMVLAVFLTKYCIFTTQYR